MRALVQRVSSASVRIDGEEIARIGPGMLVLLGVGRGDGEAEADAIASKLAKLRIFEDAEGRINEPLGDREVLCVSQFTLYADTSKGNRPGFGQVAERELARALYEQVCIALDAKRGAFGERMAVELVNDGPVTLMVEEQS